VLFLIACVTQTNKQTNKQTNIQVNLEDTQLTHFPGRVLLCDRGTLDGAAYIEGGADEVMFPELSKNFPELYFLSQVLAKNLSIIITKSIPKEFRVCVCVCVHCFLTEHFQFISIFLVVLSTWNNIGSRIESL
jgi:hypothetical protein